MRAHYLQHVPFESPGSILTALDASGCAVTSTRLFAEERLPDAGDFDLLVIMGGPMSVNDEAEFPWLTGEKALVAAAIAGGKAVLGVCLGAQIVASALGHRVLRNPLPEIGWFPVQPTSEGKLVGLSGNEPVFHWHGETFDLPSGATLLASSEACAHQAFTLGPRVFGLQFHLEVTPGDVRSMVDHGRHELVPGPFVQAAPEILSAPPQRYARSHAVMQQVLDRLLE